MSLDARCITVRFGQRTILDQVEASIPTGQITAILGPNGAGKTTLMKVLSGDLRPNEGEVSVDGQPIDMFSTSELAARRAVLPQHTRPAFGFKAWELVQLGCKPFGENQSQMIERVYNALHRVNAAYLADRDVNTLSGGERQRIFLAKALCQVIGSGTTSSAEPNYLLLDEPASALDLKQAASLMRILRDTADMGVGIAMIAHDVAAMKKYADRGLMMGHGLIETVERLAGVSDQTIARLFDMPLEDLVA